MSNKATVWHWVSVNQRQAESLDGDEIGECRLGFFLNDQNLYIKSDSKAPLFKIGEKVRCDFPGLEETQLGPFIFTVTKITKAMGLPEDSEATESQPQGDAELTIYYEVSLSRRGVRSLRRYASEVAGRGLEER